MLPDRRTVALAGGALAALTAMALSACAPVNGDGYGDAAAPRNAAASSTPEAPAEEPAKEPADAPDREPVAKQAPEDVTKQLVGKSLPKMGKVVTDEDGWILYRFDKDTADPPASNCNGDCAKVWPPAFTDGNTVVKGVDENLVGTVTRDDGARQLTINGWPVYRYIGDKKPGQWKGQAVGGVWFVVSPNGKKNLTCLPKETPKAVAPPAESDDNPSDRSAPETSGESSGGGYNY